MVGVIVPIYNVAPYLKECLESIINQSYKKLSILLINDGSSDESLEFAKFYALKDERIILIDKLNGGQAHTRNIGIDFFSGVFEFKEFEKIENLYTFKAINSNTIKQIYTKKQKFNILDLNYLIFVDSDDFLNLTCIEECVERMKNVDVLWFDYKMIMHIKKSTFNTLMQDYGYKNECVISSKEWLLNIDKHEKPLPLFWFTWQGMINFNFLKNLKLHFVNGVIFEDTLFGIILFTKAKNIYIYPKQVYNYILRAGSTMNYKKNSIEKSSYLYDLYKHFNDDFSSFKRYQQAYSWLLLCISMAEFFEKNSDESSILSKQIFMPYFLEYALNILYIQKDPLNLKARLKELKPLFERTSLFGVASLLNDYEFRLGYVFLMNYKSLKGLFLLPSLLKKEFYQCKKDNITFKENLKNYPYIHFDENKEKDNKYIKKVKNFYSYKTGKIIVKILKILRIF
ncbi:MULTISPECIES: glycosyltransferase family 2 protein [unclassified Campylobacter]|uniref:glycosyltransferase family 2 protein n=1 Tax=unclassified Campylobacter TaxID=2593542 RepID=UPI001237E857|nr:MULTISPECIES: glycosyltransferase family 2 protein [unclassified Campylobacter]KAA6225157.1 glycosyltransferase [Campylobacter sp. LR196d]KAA6226171.1 glycosyltransferase [Campylobacter sp. LR185c]KAA6228119.1 glycosyltransferase [Campylobacter sp. LR286c]KAA6231372.1 glycosyltransferase [Campylobacter sp. LR264d]KAA6231583.1 glycosyltransferase [Campylobacter sp. LR291e]